MVGIGETQYYRHGTSPDSEFKLALKAILAACEDAGIYPREIDGFGTMARSDRSTQQVRRFAAEIVGSLRSNEHDRSGE